MAEYFSDHKNDPDKVIICNEGGSRSSKTWDFFHFLVTYCDHNRGKNKDIYILRDTLVNCKDYTLKEFVKCMAVIGIPCHPVVSPKPYFNLWGNNIYFRGLDSESDTEGFPSDVTFINEALETDLHKVIGILMRCTELFVMDWNPKFTEHWAFDFANRPNCLFTHSTYKNNKHLPQSVINEIESYDPSNPENVKNSTADIYRWEVYGLGVRAARQGLIIPDVIWIDKYPDGVDNMVRGMDFGYTQNPSAITKVGTIENNLFLEKELYQPTEDFSILQPMYDVIVGKDNRCWADSENPGMISDFRKGGYQVYGITKFTGITNYGIDLLKRYKIHIVRCPEWRKEQENWCWMEVNGIRINKEVDKHNHLWKAAIYALVSEFR
jgi:phage terminase large subunit